MNTTLRNVLAVILGIAIGGIVNMAIIMISGSVIAPPEGADITTMEGLKTSMHLFEPKHYLFPFLAHSIGTFVGAFIAALIAADYKAKLALAVGLFFLIGGVVNAVILPAHGWYIAVDLVVAYVPMAWIGGKLVAGKKQ